MTEREQLEWVAKAMKLDRYAISSADRGENWFIDTGGEHLRPHSCQTDSDRMACKLRMSTRISLNDVFCVVELPRPITAYVAHNNTDEDVCRAVREARMLVAVEIGRMK